MTYLEERRKQKIFGKEPAEKKIYHIPKVSEKRKLQITEDKILGEKDKVFYKEIWDASHHVCQCGCSTPLGKEPLKTFFHHLLPKAIYPQFRHTYENIMILAPNCHAQAELDLDKVPEVRRRTEAAKKLLLKK